MKKFLPILLILILGLQFFFAVKPVFAQTPSSSGTTTTTDANGNVPNVPCPPNGWQQDSEVTFIGKVGKRSEDFLDWTLQNYHWVDLAAGAANPVQDFWSRIRNIVYVFFPFIILISAFILIITRGKSVTLSRFAIRFLIVAFLVTFSFAIIQLFYQFFDVIQEFFLKSIKGGGLIGTKNLLYVGFNYDFTGYRCVGIAYDESAFISLLLVKLTAITYYVMTGVLLLRKIILWFFIIVSPIFPLLLLYAPVRNTGKIWIGEFFRWLLYAPLFAIFLAGLVNLWSDDKVGIPLHFGPKPMEYQTAVNILLGGPKETVSLANSVNTPDTFAKYVVALLMLWVVIILPFLLLQIFLDYFHAFSFSESPVIKQMLAAGGGLIGKNPSPPSPAPVNPQQPTGTGMARLLPFGNKIAIPTTMERGQGMAAQIPMQRTQSVENSAEILRLTNLSIPTMRDIARFETSTLSTNAPAHSDVSRMQETLGKIANPTSSNIQTDRQRFANLRQRLVNEKQKGNPLAASVLTAASATTPSSILSTKQDQISKLQTVLKDAMNPQSANVSSDQKQKLQTIKQQLTLAQHQGDPLATSVLSAMNSQQGIDDTLKERLQEAKEKGSSLATVILDAANLSVVAQNVTVALPSTNRIQSVSLDDYESVKKIWQENYQKLEPPHEITGKQPSRKDWIQSEIDKITNTINMLLSKDPQNAKKGMEAVGNILPFLLIGGFSQSEVVAYLKAKLEAAKDVLSQVRGKDEEESTTLSAQKQKEEQKTLKAEAEIDDKEEKGIQ